MNLNLFEFTEVDLKSNQRGFITMRQKEWLAGMAQGVRKTSQFNAWIALGFVLFGSGLTFGLYMQNEDSRTAFFSNPINVFVLPVTVLIVIGILTPSIYFAQRLANKLTTPHIQLAEGKARLEEENGQNTGGTFYLAYIGRKKFSFADNVDHIFQEGTRYRVYYCKAGILEFVLSLERVES